MTSKTTSVERIHQGRGQAAADSEYKAQKAAVWKRKGLKVKGASKTTKRAATKKAAKKSTAKRGKKK